MARRVKGPEAVVKGPKALEAPGNLLERVFEQERCGVGPRCSFCGTSTGPFSEVEGLFTVLMCTRCRAIRHASPPPLLAHHDPGEPWLKWGCPIRGCGHRVIIPHELEGHTAAEHPGWVARYELVQPYPNQLERVVYRQLEDPAG